MYYTSLEPSNWYDNSLHLAISMDGFRWRRLSREPIIQHGGPEDWDGGTIGSCAVWQQQDGWRMLYTGGTIEPRRVCLGLAFSDDGLVWRKYKMNPVMEPYAEETTVSKPYVVREGRRLHLWFSRYKETYRIEHAFSDDRGLTWERDGVVIEAQPASEWCSEMVCYPFVFHENGKKWLFFSGDGYGAGGCGVIRLHQ